MNEIQSTSIHERNPVTHARHSKQVFWQIILPMLVALLILIAVAILAGISGSAPARLWADISLIWLIVLAIPPILVVAVLIMGLAYLTIRLIGIIPRYTLRIQGILGVVQEKVHTISDKVSAPFIKINGFVAGVKKAREE